MKKVGQIGFICPKDEANRPYDFCIYECQERCEPLPLLMAMMSDRKIKKNSYSVTEVLNPPQITYLQRNFPYYCTPESLIWMGFGSGFHKFIESGKWLLKKHDMEEEHQMEEPFEREFDFPPPTGKTKLRGRVDLWQPAFKRLWDFKTMKAYAAKKLKAGYWAGVNYAMQLNIYKHYGFPEAEELWVEALIKDWSERVGRTDNLKSLEQFKVPDIPKDEVTMFVDLKLIELVKNQQNSKTIIPCSGEETWGGNRCKKYCAVAEICQQYQKGKLN